MADDLVVRAIEAVELRDKATHGNWSIESCGEKGDGSDMIGVAFDPQDVNCERPLSGWLPAYRPVTNEEIEYYRDELVAECQHRNRNPGNDAAFIAHAGNHYAEIARAYLAVVAERDGYRTLLAEALEEKNAERALSGRLREKVTKKETKLAAMAVELDEATKVVSSLAKTVGHAHAQLAAMTAERDALSADLERVQTELDEEAAQLTASEAARGRLEAQIAEYCTRHGVDPDMALTPRVDGGRDPRDPDLERNGIFRDHNCWKCKNGAGECAEGNPRQCQYPHARND